MLTLKCKIKRVVLYGIQNDTMWVIAIVFAPVIGKNRLRECSFLCVWMLPEGENQAGVITGTASGPSG